MTTERWRITDRDAIAVANGEKEGWLIVQAPPSHWPGARDYPRRKHLIAAAPDLLAACELVNEWDKTPGSPPHWNAVEPVLLAAIAKARGQNPVPVSTPAVEAKPTLRTWHVWAKDAGARKVEAERIYTQDDVVEFWTGVECVARFRDYTYWWAV